MIGYAPINIDRCYICVYTIESIIYVKTSFVRGLVLVDAISKFGYGIIHKMRQTAI